jgi:glycerol-3-phosphate dehydrogenase (NAD(P)+)
MADFAILGSGSMGTALGHLLASNGAEILMWARRREIAETINRKRINNEYMPRVTLPEGLKATTSLTKCLEDSEKMILTIPSHAVDEIFSEIARVQTSKKHWLSAIKGMDQNLGLTTSQKLQHQLGVEKERIAVLSGPDFAIEIVERLPTIGIIGSESKATAVMFSDSMATNDLLIMVTSDVLGVEIGGILKNIGAVAIGLVDGLNLGDNTRGLIFSRFMLEALEIGKSVFGVQEDTLLGPACLGDMITTSFSLKSRNRIIGLLASKCFTNIPKDTFVSEGRGSTRIIKDLSKDHNVATPITDFVDAALSGKKPFLAFSDLWEQLKKECAGTFIRNSSMGLK